jgi:hypothetical protein
MSPGYVDTMVAALKTADDQFTLDNRAVGANNCVHGLQLVRGIENLASYDAVLIEYVVNDNAMGQDQQWETWQSAYEAIIRYILAKTAGKTKVINIILARRDEKTYPCHERIRAAVVELSKYYQQYGSVVDYIDVNEWLRSQIKDANTFKRLYMDSSHYSRPLASGMLGAYISAHVLKILIADRHSVDDGWQLPTPKFTGFFDDVSVMSMVDCVTHFPQVPFVNSRFQMNSIKLEEGQELQMTLPGGLISLTYACTASSGAICIREENEIPFVIDTSHVWTQEKEGRFMIKDFSLRWRTWRKSAQRPRKITLASLSAQARADWKGRVRGQYNIAPPPPSDQPLAVYIAVLMCAG